MSACKQGSARLKSSGARGGPLARQVFGRLGGTFQQAQGGSREADCGPGDFLSNYPALCFPRAPRGWHLSVTSQGDSQRQKSPAQLQGVLRQLFFQTCLASQHSARLNYQDLSGNPCLTQCKLPKVRSSLKGCLSTVDWTTSLRENAPGTSAKGTLTRESDALAEV